MGSPPPQPNQAKLVKTGYGILDLSISEEVFSQTLARASELFKFDAD